MFAMNAVADRSSANMRLLDWFLEFLGLFLCPGNFDN